MHFLFPVAFVVTCLASLAAHAQTPDPRHFILWTQVHEGAVPDPDSPRKQWASDPFPTLGECQTASRTGQLWHSIARTVTMQSDGTTTITDAAEDHGREYSVCKRYEPPAGR